MPAGADAEFGYNIHVDVKGKRKMAVGDSIVLLGRATVSDAFDMAGVLTAMGLQV